MLAETVCYLLAGLVFMAGIHIAQKVKQDISKVLIIIISSSTLTIAIILLGIATLLHR